MNAHERALGYVFEVLCALCAVAAFLACVTTQVGWTLVLAGCSLACFEAASELELER